ncbi:MAG: hypothetical protein ACRDH2_10580, partial [Anaerolineales bacterium]
MGQIERREWRWVVAFAAVVMGLTALPYLVGAITAARTGWSFSGFLLAVEDGNSYIVKMGEG